MRQGGLGAVAWLSGGLHNGDGSELRDDEDEERSPSEQINDADRHGQTALFYACEKVDLALVRALLAVEGVDVDHQDHNGNTALIQLCAAAATSAGTAASVARADNAAIVRLLVRRGAAVNKFNAGGELCCVVCCMAAVATAAVAAAFCPPPPTPPIIAHDRAYRSLFFSPPPLPHPHCALAPAGYNALLQAAAMGDAALVAELLEAVRKASPRLLPRLLAATDSGGRRTARQTALELGHDAVVAVLEQWETHLPWMATVSLAKRTAAAAADAGSIVGKSVNIAGAAPRRKPPGGAAAAAGGRRRGGSSGGQRGVVTSFKQGRFLGFGASTHTVQLDAAAEGATVKMLLLRHGNGGVPFVLLGKGGEGGEGDDSSDDDDGSEEDDARAAAARRAPAPPPRGAAAAAAVAPSPPAEPAAAGRKPRSIILLERQLRQEQAAYGVEHSNVAHTLAKIGQEWLEAGDAERALEELGRAHAIIASTATASGDADLVQRYAGLLDVLIEANERVGDALKVSELREELNRVRRA